MTKWICWFLIARASADTWFALSACANRAAHWSASRDIRFALPAQGDERRKKVLQIGPARLVLRTPAAHRGRAGGVAVRSITIESLAAGVSELMW